MLCCYVGFGVRIDVVVGGVVAVVVIAIVDSDCVVIVIDVLYVGVVGVVAFDVGVVC